jgi:hypothetical protein
MNKTKYFTITEDLREENKQNSLFYGGDIVSLSYKGFTFVISAIGDIRVTIINKITKEETYIKDKQNFGKFAEELEHAFNVKNDEELTKFLNDENYDFDWSDNNWWECGMIDPNGKWNDLMWCLDSDEINQAIEEVINSEAIDGYIEEYWEEE